MSPTKRPPSKDSPTKRRKKSVAASEKEASSKWKVPERPTDLDYLAVFIQSLEGGKVDMQKAAKKLHTNPRNLLYYFYKIRKAYDFEWLEACNTKLLPDEPKKRKVKDELEIVESIERDHEDDDEDAV
ncbi:hypothetical protein N7520_008199 [Penicillium odoratum]|uniref:uncharacterized protein n=1 Tax=Penicillium odoratum TaxID=1167516 RepID=UPI0025492143|nr:uncharacterized protein N7520_008199 [Penicillium odoratum]KAJ5761043.1 hypothetical protein N7520_008199 [Penicillium odoratum]